MAPRVRVGVDLVSVADVARSVEQFGEQYLGRLFTAREVADCDGEPGVQAEGLAARFAAKEATIKLLRPTTETINWRSVEVVRAEGGWVELRLTGAAAELARRDGVVDLSVALSHEAGLATAVVVGMCSDEESGCV